MSIRSWSAPLAVLLSLSFAAGCQTVQTTRGGTVGIEREQTMLVSSAEMNQAAEQSYKQVLEQAKAKGQLNRDAAQLKRLRAISQRLIPHTGEFRNDAPGWNWEVNLITSKELNAWCMPGGKIAFYTGLMDTLKLDDAEIAAVMGHEIAHALREHARERASRQMAAGVGISVASAALGLGKGGTDLAKIVTDLTLLRPHSRLHETEADRIGVELAARAGFDPRAAVTVWQKMSKNSDGQPPEWLSTHPSHQTRLQDLEVYAARVMPLYEKAKR